MSARLRVRILALALALSLAPQTTGFAMAEERVLTLREAIDMAVRKNEGLRIERESLGAARAAVTAAKGAYDPRLELDGGWQRSTEPVNSSFSGAPAGHVAFEIEASEAGAAIRQLLPAGGALSLTTRGSRETTVARARRGRGGGGRSRGRRGRQAVEVQLSAERDRFATGLSTNFLVLTRQNDLSRARLDEISALTDYRVARTEMARASGALLEERGIEIGRTDR